MHTAHLAPHTTSSRKNPFGFRILILLSAIGSLILISVGTICNVFWRIRFNYITSMEKLLLVCAPVVIESLFFFLASLIWTIYWFCYSKRRASVLLFVTLFLLSCSQLVPPFRFFSQGFLFPFQQYSLVIALFLLCALPSTLTGLYKPLLPQLALVGLFCIKVYAIVFDQYRFDFHGFFTWFWDCYANDVGQALLVFSMFLFCCFNTIPIVYHSRKPLTKMKPAQALETLEWQLKKGKISEDAFYQQRADVLNRMVQHRS